MTTWVYYRCFRSVFVCIRVELSTHRREFSLSNVPEALPKVDVQVLGDAFKFRPSQLRVNGVLPWGKERAGCHPWWMEEGRQNEEGVKGVRDTRESETRKEMRVEFREKSKCMIEEVVKMAKKSGLQRQRLQLRTMGMRTERNSRREGRNDGKFELLVHLKGGKVKGWRKRRKAGQKRSGTVLKHGKHQRTVTVENNQTRQGEFAFMLSQL